MATTTYHAQLIKYLANGDQYILNLKNTGDDVSISRSSNGNLPSAATTAQGLANSLGALAFRSSLGKGDVGLGNVDNTADSAKSVKYATSAGSASSATKATQDSSSQTITSTYIKSLSVSGRTITFTRGNNTTGTITTQDTDTTYSVGTSTYSGTTKLYTTTGRNTDGTMTQKAIWEILTGAISYNAIWTLCHHVYGWGMICQIPWITTGKINITKMEVFHDNDGSGWAWRDVTSYIQNITYGLHFCTIVISGGFKDYNVGYSKIARISCSIVDS